MLLNCHYAKRIKKICPFFGYVICFAQFHVIILISAGFPQYVGISHTHCVFILCTCRYFNSLQSECFSICFYSDVNMVVSAPTGSGKTVLFELCILRLLSRFISEGRFVHRKGTLKTVSPKCSMLLAKF